MYDVASFAGGSKLPDIQQKFVQALAPAIANFCKNRLSQDEMRQCLDEAVKASGWGRFVLANNYWMLPGRGDRGAFLLVRVRTDYTSPGSVVPVVSKYAKFSSLPAALDAWCKRRGK